MIDETGQPDREQRKATITPRVPYVTHWESNAYHKGAENRIYEAGALVNSEKRVYLSDFYKLSHKLVSETQ